MSEACLELCGAFASTERWQKAWDLLQSKDCSLQELRIPHNTEQQVLETCRALHHNSSVQELHVGVLEEAGAAAVSSLLQGDSSIRGLHVQQLVGPRALGALVPCLAGSGCRLQRLTLCRLDQTALTALAAAMTGSTLTSVTLPDCRLDSSSAAALCAALAALPCLTRLALPRAAIQPSSSQGAVCGALLAPPLAAAGRLTALDLSGSPLHPAGAAAVGSFLGAAAALTHLTAAECQLGDAGGAALAQAAAAAAGGRGGAGGSLQELILDSNALGAATCCALASWATTPTTHSSSGSSATGPWGQLRLLSLCNNALAGGDLVALGPGLAAAPALVEVRLGGNKLTDVGPLASLLSSPTCTLTALDISSNAVGDAGAAALATALATHTSLARLSLAHTRVGDSGAAALAAVLAGHPGPWAALDLSHCRLRNTGLNALLDAALGNGGVLELGVEGHGATDRGLRTVAADVGRALAERRRKGPSRGVSRRSSTPTSADRGAAANASGGDSTFGGMAPGGVAAGVTFSPAQCSSAAAGGEEAQEAEASWEGWASSNGSGERSSTPVLVYVPPASQAADGDVPPAVEAVVGAGSRRSSSSTAAGLDPAPAAKSPRLGEAGGGIDEPTTDADMSEAEGLLRPGSSQSVLSCLPPRLALFSTRSISLEAWGRSASASSRASSGAWAPGSNPGSLLHSASASSLSESEVDPGSPLKAAPLTSALLEGLEAAGPGGSAPANDPLGLLPGLTPVWAQPSLDAWAAEAAAGLGLGSPRPLARAGSSGAWAFSPLSRSGSGVGPGGKALVRAGSLVAVGAGGSSPPAAPGRQDSCGVVAVARRRGSKGGATPTTTTSPTPSSKGSRLAAMSGGAGGGLQVLGAVMPEPVSLAVYKARAAAVVGSRVKGGAYRPGPWGALAAAGGQLAPPGAPALSSPGAPPLPAVGVAARCAAAAALAPAVRGGACLSAAFLDDSEEAMEALDL